MRIVRGEIDVDAVAGAIEAGDGQLAESLLQLDRLAKELEPMLAALRSAQVAVGRAAAAQVAARITTATAFNAAGDRVVAWLAEHGGALITGIDEQQRTAVRARLAKVSGSGLSPRAAALVIREHVGQSARDSDAIHAFGERLREGGADEATTVRRVGRYARRKLLDRADTIADHEALEAAGAGRQESWTQAVEAGILPAEVRRRPVVAGDERQCRICDSVRHKTFAMDEDIIPGRRHTPLHVKCRCAEVLVWPDEEAGVEGEGE